MEKEELFETIRSLLEKKDYQGLRKLAEDMNPVDFAEVSSEVTSEQLLILFRLLPKDLAADAFAEMDPDEQERLLQGFTDQEVHDVLEEMSVDDAVDMVEEMPANVVKRILAMASPDTRKEINQLLKYPEDSAGALMTTEYVALKENTTALAAIDWIRKNGDDREDIYTCYVLDPSRKLIGVVTMRELLLAKDDVKIADLMNENVIQVETSVDKEEAAKLFDRYNLSTLPVTDGEGRLVGIITVDDALDVIQEEATEDFEKMAALAPREDTYLDTPILKHVKSRLPWLFVLMFSSIFTGLIIEKYEIAFAAQPLLVALMPMLMDTGGNAGAQSSTLIIRSMATDEIELKDFVKVFWKECRVSLITGSVLAVANGIRIYIQYHSTSLAVIIVLTLVLDILIANLIGASLPMLAKKLNLDPALMASPLMTTIVDVAAVFIYFQIAVKVLGL